MTQETISHEELNPFEVDGIHERHGPIGDYKTVYAKDKIHAIEVAREQGLRATHVRTPIPFGDDLPRDQTYLYDLVGTDENGRRIERAVSTGTGFNNLEAFATVLEERGIYNASIISVKKLTP